MPITTQRIVDCVGGLLGMGILAKMMNGDEVDVPWKWVAVIAVSAIGTLIAFELVTIKSGIGRLEAVQVDTIKNEGKMREDFQIKLGLMNESISKLCQKVDDHIEHTRPMIEGYNGKNGKKW